MLSVERELLSLKILLAAHVSGYMLKDAPPDQLAAAIRNVAAGRRVIDTQLALSAWDGGQSPLSAREHEVLRLAADGAEPGESIKCCVTTRKPFGILIHNGCRGCAIHRCGDPGGSSPRGGTAAYRLPRARHLRRSASHVV